MRKLKSKRKKKVSTIDPFCNIPSRRQLLVAKQNQVDQAPINPDDQPITARQREIMTVLTGKTFPKKKKKKKVKRLQDAPKQPLSRKARKKKKKQEYQQQESKDMDNTIKEEAAQDKLTRLPGESDKKFLRRINSQADTEIKNQMDEIRLLGKHAPDILDDLKKEKKVSKKDKSDERLEKHKEKKKNKLLEKKIDKLEDQFFKDKVEFGEVAGRPPELSFQPRKSQPSNTAGQRKLLLSNIMKESQSTTSTKPTAKGSGQHKTQKQHKFKKRKDMDNAERRIFDKKRQEAINAYRQVKADAMAKRTLES